MCVCVTTTIRIAVSVPLSLSTAARPPCRVMYLLGYIPKENRLYLGDKELNIVSYSLLLSVLEYQTAVMRKDFETADKVLPDIPRDQRTRVAHFLEKQVCVVCWPGLVTAHLFGQNLPVAISVRLFSSVKVISFTGVIYCFWCWLTCPRYSCCGVVLASVGLLIALGSLCRLGRTVDLLSDQRWVSCYSVAECCCFEVLLTRLTFEYWECKLLCRCSCCYCCWVTADAWGWPSEALGLCVEGGRVNCSWCMCVVNRGYGGLFGGWDGGGVW